MAEDAYGNRDSDCRVAKIQISSKFKQPQKKKKQIKDSGHLYWENDQQDLGIPEVKLEKFQT